MFYIAQTNLQLFNQMMSSNYSLQEIEFVGCAYELASESFNCRFRGSGKPLLCHLVGVASILVAIRRPVETVVAGLLHASIGDADFGVATAREVISERCGADSFDLIESYMGLQYSYSDDQVIELGSKYFDLEPRIQEVIIIRLANEIEDYIDQAINYYSDDKNKGYMWRLDYVATTFPTLLKIATSINQDRLAVMIKEVLADALLLQSCAPKIPLDSCLRKSGKMYFLMPKSLRKKYTIICRTLVVRIIRKIGRTLKFRN